VRTRLAVAVTGLLALRGCDIDLSEPHAHAQRFNIEGTVTWMSDQTPIAGAIVSLTWDGAEALPFSIFALSVESSSISTTTDDAGRYQVQTHVEFDFDCSRFGLVASHPEASSQTLPVACSADRQTVDLQLAPSDELEGSQGDALRWLAGEGT